MIRVDVERETVAVVGPQLVEVKADVGGAVARVSVPGPPGPPTRLTVGTVTTSPPGGQAAAAVTGTPPVQVLDLTLPRGETGPAIGGLLTAKGDLPVRDGAGAVRLPVGGDGMVLTALASAPAGVGWSTSIGAAETPSAATGADLGSGSGLVQTVACVIGRTYTAGGAGVTGITVDGAALVVSGGWSSWVATAATHTVVGVGGSLLQVMEVGTAPPLLTAGGTLEIRRRGMSLALGHTAQYALTTGTYNNALGHLAQRALTTGSSNTALGHAAQYALTTGSYNTALGHAAQYALTTGSYNTALGHAAQRALTTGSYNSALGHGAQYSPSQRPDVRGTVAIGTDSTGIGAWTDRDDTIVLGTPLHTLILRGPGRGIEMPSADGKRWIVRVTDAGALEVVPA